MKAGPILLTAFCAVGIAGSARSFDDEKIIAKCDEEWGNDFEMVAYCRDQQRAAGAQWDRIEEQAIEGSDDAAIVAHCRAQWEGDYEMLVYCNDQQFAARRALTQTPGDVPPDTVYTVTRDCEANWGKDFEMVLYCRDQQIEAWRGLQ